MLICFDCGETLPDNVLFCLHCGNRISKPDNEATVIIHKKVKQPALVEKVAKPVHSAQKTNKKGFAKVVAIAIALAAVIVAAIQIYPYLNLQNSSLPKNTSTQLPTETIAKTPTPLNRPKKKSTPVVESSVEGNNENTTNAKQTLFDKTFLVNARQSVSFPFIINRSANLTGTFRASGGKNDIDCIVLEEGEFENFSNGNNFRSFYRSQYVTSGNIDIFLAPGSYRVVFSNTIALLTNKMVESKFEIE